MKKMKGSETILCDPEKQKYVRRFIQEGHWSPEQLSNRLKLESAEVQIGYAAIYRTLKAWVFDWNKRAISRSKKQALAYHLRRKGKNEVRSGINAGKAPIL